jgi:ABC-type transport system involved in multi-copper enzyme maturation permease subunit
MRNALTIAAREFEEKRFVAYAAVAFAILPFILAATPAIGGKSPRETIAIASLIFATGFAASLALMTGASFVGRDLSDGRLSFYFSRPVSSASIWFGKLTAGILMVVGCFGVIIAPAWLATGELWKSFWSQTLGESTKYILAVALALFLIAHVISTFARSRSPLIVLDFAAAVVCGLVIRFLALQLAAGQAIVLATWLAISLASALVLSIVCGGAWQLARGRIDRKRNHLALSQAIWGTMAAALLIVGTYVWWVASVSPSDITVDMRANRSTSGPFALITGKSRGRGDYRAGFLLNTDDGSVTRVSSFAVWFVHYTRDGRSALIPQADFNMHPANLFIYRKGVKEPIDTGLTIPLGDYFASDDGGRLATLSREDVLSVYDVAQKRSLVSVKLPQSMYVRAFFVSPDVVRLYLDTREGMKIGEIDARAGGGFRETGTVATNTAALIYPDSSVTHMLVRPVRGADVVTLNDARTGALITTLASGTHVKTARFLRDGRIAIVDGPESATVLHIFTAGGVLEHDVPLGPSQQTILIGDDGVRVVLAIVSLGRNALLAANLNRGVIERRETVPFWVPSGFGDPRPPIEPLRDVFYGDGTGHMMSWNPATGAKRRIT